MNELATSQLPPVDGAPGLSGEPVIVARNLRREFGKEVALDRLDLTVPRGLIFGFVGPSGSGKTTAIRLLTGIDQPTEGEVEVLGSNRFDGSLRARIGYMPQGSVQFPNLSVAENMSFVASMYGLPLRRRQIIARALQQTELYEHRRKTVRKLSGGMQRRLALSAALVHDPEVLFLDEPTAGIDPVLRRTLWDHFERLRDQGRTLFVTTQYVTESAYCDRVGVLAQGRLVAEGTPDELRREAIGGDVLELRPAAPLDETVAGQIGQLPGVCDVRWSDDGAMCITVDSAATRLMEIQRWCEANSIEVDSLQTLQTSFDDVFAALMRRHGGSPTPEDTGR